MPLTLGIIGGGQMAHAIVQGQSDRREIGIKDILINDINQERTALFVREFKAEHRTIPELIKASDIILLAVKPQQARDVLRDTKALWSNDKLLVSIVAGIKLKSLEDLIGQIPVVRTVPNTPCLAGMGVVAISGGNYIDERHIKITERLFINMAKCIIIEENYLNAITAFSGSGPAYFYYIAEALRDGAKDLGLDSQLAEFLIVETLRGSMELLDKTGESPEVLREKVSTPGGATEAAICHLESREVKAAYREAVQRAFQKVGEFNG
ncbi:MAG: pyrroline-5-carboxylate reductase [Syntrophomonadaceae bacterium]|nr:pyrroline-5-carboxylate reductase [Syntrophomonadaceae bacterium]